MSAVSNVSNSTDVSNISDANKASSSTSSDNSKTANETKRKRPRIAYYKENLPIPLCIFFSFFFAMAFQFNGGVFLPTAMQMSSELGCIKEDVSMAGYASFIGMTIIFPILFRLKFRFTTRSILLTVCPVLIICNLITMHTGNLALMILVCFISGFFRMWGTFECFSNMRLTITPAGDFSTFYPVIYIIVLESIQLSGLVATHITDWANWRYMHWFVIFMVGVVWLLVFLFTRHVRPGKVVPLYNIDWIGALLWVIFLFSVVFVCIYGEFYDWLASAEIRACIVIAVVALLLNYNRMHTLKRPYVEPDVFTYPKFPLILVLFLALCIYLTTSTVLQTLFMSSILKYDTLNSVSLNWCAFAGILCGSGIVFYRRVVQHKGFKMLIFIGFCLLTIYQYYMYFLIDPNLNIESLYIPNFLRGIGYGMLYISLTIYIAVSIPFKHFFQALCVLSFIRTSIATPLGTALLNRALKYLQQDNIANISRNMDQVRAWEENIPIDKLYSIIQMQTTLTSLKELFGWICIQGTIFLLIIMAYRIWRDRDETFRHPAHKALHFHRRVKTRMKNRFTVF